jgi:hypothetical protein
VTRPRSGRPGFDSWQEEEFVSWPSLPVLLWSPPSLLSNRYRVLFPRRWSGRGVKLAVRLSLGAGLAQWYSAGLRAGCSVVRVPAGTGNFSLHHCIQTSFGAHPASYPRVKRSGREADHSPPFSSEVKNEWSYTSTSQYAFMAWWSIKKSTGTILPFTILRVSDQCDPPPSLLPGERASCAHWIGGWVGLRAGLDAVVKRKIPAPTGYYWTPGRSLVAILTCKAKLPMCLTKYHAMKTYPLLNYAPRREDVLGSGGTACFNRYVLEHHTATQPKIPRLESPPPYLAYVLCSGGDVEIRCGVKLEIVLLCY